LNSSQLLRAPRPINRFIRANISTDSGILIEIPFSKKGGSRLSIAFQSRVWLQFVFHKCSHNLLSSHWVTVPEVSKTSNCDFLGVVNRSMIATTNKLKTTPSSDFVITSRDNFVFQPQFPSILLLVHFNNFIDQQIVDDFQGLYEAAFPNMILLSTDPAAQTNYQVSRPHIGPIRADASTNRVSCKMRSLTVLHRFSFSIELHLFYFLGLDATAGSVMGHGEVSAV
jgi:hypothetical protein